MREAMPELELVPSQKNLHGTPRTPSFPNLAFTGQPAPPETESPRPGSAAQLPEHHARSIASASKETFGRGVAIVSWKGCGRSSFQ